MQGPECLGSCAVGPGAHPAPAGSLATEMCFCHHCKTGPFCCPEVPFIRGVWVGGRRGKGREGSPCAPPAPSSHSHCALDTEPPAPGRQVRRLPEGPAPSRGATAWSAWAGHRVHRARPPWSRRRAGLAPLGSLLAAREVGTRFQTGLRQASQGGSPKAQALQQVAESCPCCRQEAWPRGHASPSRWLPRPRRCPGCR